MTTILLLFLLGIAFILIEVIIPGGILGVIGALLMLGGCVMSFVEFGSGGGMIASAAALVAGGIALWIEFRILPNTKMGRRAFLTKQITGVSAAFGKEAETLIGKPAKAITTLSPSGYISIDGKRYEAFCQSGFTETGTPVKVIGADNFRLIVSSSQPDNTTT